MQFCIIHTCFVLSSSSGFVKLARQVTLDCDLLQETLLCLNFEKVKRRACSLSSRRAVVGPC